MKWQKLTKSKEAMSAWEWVTIKDSIRDIKNKKDRRNYCLHAPQCFKSM